MPKYTYRAKKGPGTIIEGTIEAENKDAAINRLIETGSTPVQIKEDLKGDKRLSFFIFSRRINPRDITIVTQQLASLIKAKVSLLDAIGILLKQTDNKYLSSILSNIYKELKDGKLFSDALSKEPKFFSPLYINMIRAGEFGGVLENSLARLSSFREEEEEMKATITSALAYPIFIIIVGIITVFILISFAVPRLTILFEESGQALPFITRLLISVANSIKNYWYLPVAIVSGIIFMLKRRGFSPNEKLVLDRIKLRLPILGKLIKNVGLARFSRSFGVLLGSGIPVIQAIRISLLTVDNEIFKSALQEVEKSIVDGASLAESIENLDYFPPFMANMIAVGEKGGNLEGGLLETAYFYERDVRKMTKIITSLLEPAIILIMGLIVGVIVFAMLLPIFEINLAVR